MTFKLAYYAAAFALAAIATGPSAANEDADRALRERRLKQYAADIVAKYPAHKAYMLHNKTDLGMAPLDHVYAAMKEKGMESIVYDGFNQGDTLGEKDYKYVEQADVFFCGCTESEARAIKGAVTKQGFTGQFVALSEPN